MTESIVDGKHKRLKHVLKKCWLFFGIFIVLIAIVFSVFRALTPWARQYKPAIEEQLTTILGQPVTIGTMQTGWYWLRPVLQLNKVALTDHQDNTLKLNKLLVGINIFSSILHWKVQPGIIYVDNSHFVLHQVKDHWALEGLNLTGQSTEFGPEVYLPLLTWLSGQEKIIVRHASLTAHFQDGTVVPLTNINVILQTQSGGYRLKGAARIARKIPTDFTMYASLQLNPFALEETKGQIYLAVQSLFPGQWSNFLPPLPMKVEHGRGNATLWLELDHGKLIESQGSLQFSQLVLNRKSRAELYKIKTLSADIGWKKTKHGWDLNGSHLQLDMDGTKWPENSFFIHHKEPSEGDRIFVQHLLLTPLLAMDVPWPQELSPILNRNPRGQLYSTELHIKEQAIDYLLTGFSDLGWKASKQIPAVSGLSGVVHWQPHEGRLDLDSYHTKIQFTGLPAIALSQINTVLEWKPLGNGLRVNLENFVIENPDLTLTAGGVLDNPQQFPDSQLHLTTQFSANDAEQWLKYIPSGSMKEKLEQWLKQDIKKIGKASGQMTVDGRMSDFPFDKEKGEFSLLTYLTGVDLLIGPKWPLTRDIDAYLKVDKRNFNVDIQHANLNNIDVNNMNLRIDDIGLGYETLLLHGIIEAKAQQMLAYLFDSPLEEKLSQLKALDLRGILGLDLKIEVPLYPENDDVLTQGAITFTDNQLILHQGSMELPLENLNGVVAFNEDGILKSALTGTFANGPLSLNLESQTQPKPATIVKIASKTTMSLLRQAFDLSALRFMQGPLVVDGVLTLTDSATDMDNLKLHTSLDGVVVDLPSPLGKSANSTASLIANIDFNAKKTPQIRLDYDNHAVKVNVKAAQLDNKTWSLQINQKEFAADVQYQSDNHTLNGKITRLHLDNLFDSKHPNSKSTLVPQDIPNLHLDVQNFTYGDVDIGDVHIDSKSTEEKLQVESLQVKSPFYELELKGDWIKEEETNHTDIQAALKIIDLEKGLAHWHAKPVVESHKGVVYFSGGWPGGFTDFSLAKVMGKIQVNIKDGRITDLSSETEEKLGLGKLLSILSLQTIPRRLSLDFSDLAKKGYSFDQFKGDLELKQGIMSTQNSEMDGPVAFVSMKGHLDVLKQLCSLEIYVSPHVMASLPVVATIAGGPVGPIAGVATWLAIKIINKSMLKVTGYTYTVSGPWSNPVVQQLNIYKRRVKGS